jgi:nucleotide-binding universal stress UspA family protein
VSRLQPSGHGGLRAIVVPLDGSSFALQALPAALGLAARSNAALHLVHAQTHPVPLVDLPGAPAFDVALAAEQGVETERNLQEVAGRIRARWKLEVVVAIRFGRAGETIAAYARELGADMIVMATHGRGGVSRFWLGSVADELLRIADVPVLAVRPARRDPGLRERRFRHLLATLDGSDLAEQALAPAVVTARLWNARLTLLRVITPHLAIARPAPVTRLDRADLARQKQQAEDYLRGVADRVHQEGVSVTTRVVAHADPARAIIRAATASRADLIVIASHARGGLGRLLRGSVCDKVLRGATRAAILLTRPDGAAPWSTQPARS